jgi:hypothetical protein
MQFSDVILLLILLGCMASYIPVFMCLFFTATLGFLLLYRSSSALAVSNHLP